MYLRIGGGLRLVFSGYIDFVFHIALHLEVEGMLA